MTSRSAPELTAVRLRPALGCFVRVAATGPEAARSVERAFAALNEVEALMSFHRPDSALHQLHRAPLGAWVPVPRPLWEVLQHARSLCELSNGWFDPGIAPALVAEGLLPAPVSLPRPDAGAGLRDLDLREGAQARWRRRAWLDLGGIAKGYAVDRALQVLKEARLTSASVNAGGDLACFGAAETVGLRDPREPVRLRFTLPLVDGAAATSGSYFSPRALRGRAGVLPRRRGGSVTVLAPDCMTADALTKLVWANPRRALPVLRAYQARAVQLDGRARLRWLTD